MAVLAPRGGGEAAAAVVGKASLDEVGFAVLSSHARSLLDRLRASAAALVFDRMDVMPHTQPDRLRRHHTIPPGEVHTALLAHGRELMARLLGEECPVYKPAFLATAPGAADQREHLDHDAPDSYSILIAVDPRRFFLKGRTEPIALPGPGDVLVFNARWCHWGAGRAADAEGVAFAVHMYAGRGVTPSDLEDTFDCGATRSDLEDGVTKGAAHEGAAH